MRRLLILAVLLVPSLASAQGLGEIFEGLTNPNLVVGATYLPNAPEGYSEFGAIVTANVVGPKLGTIPCYIAGVGVGLETVAPGLDQTPYARWSIPLLTCNPWSEQIVLQVGTADVLSAPEPEPSGDTRSWYIGIGVSVQSPTTLKAKRIKRIEAKAKRRADASQGPPAPAAQ
jgi:hypothetical protein